MQKIVPKRETPIKICELLDCEKRVEINEMSDKWKKKKSQEHEFSQVNGQFFNFRVISQDCLDQFIEFVQMSAVQDMFLQEMILEKSHVMPDCKRNMLR